MKKKFLSAFAAATLFAAVGLSLGGCALFTYDNGDPSDDNSDTGWKYGKYSDADSYSAGSFEYGAGAVKKVEIDWVSGSVKIEQTDSDVFKVSEDCDFSSEELLHYCLDNGTLKIKFCKSGYRFPSSLSGKNLIVEVPDNIEEIDIRTVSSDVDFSDLTTQDVTVETVSGHVSFGKLSVSSADIDSVSGNVSAREVNAVETLDANSVSGYVRLYGVSALCDVTAESTSGVVDLDIVAVRSASLETISGDIKLKIADAFGATVTVETDGDVNTDSAAYAKANGLSRVKKYVKGDGKYEIEISSETGDVTLR